MTKKKNQKKAVAQAKKSVVDTLRFQAHWGLKQLGHEDGNMFHKFVDVEVDFIAEHDTICQERTQQSFTKCQSSGNPAWV